MGVSVREKVKGSGIWWIFVAHRGLRTSKLVGTRKAAREVATEIEREIAAERFNIHPPAPNIVPTFSEYAEKWMAGHAAANLKTSTVRGYRGVLDSHILPAFAHRPLDAITREDIKALCYERLRAGRLKPKKREDGSVDATLAPRSVSYITRTLSAIFSHAVEDGIIPANPASRPGRFLKTGDRQDKIGFLTREEGRALLDAARASHARFHSLLMTAMRTGMRQGELLALKWCDIDWRGKFIEVRRSNYMGNVTTPKNGKARRIDMSEQLAVVLTDQRRLVLEESIKEGRPFPEWVFPSESGCALDAANVRRAFLGSLKKAGLRQVRFHDLRHSKPRSSNTFDPAVFPCSWVEL